MDLSYFPNIGCIFNSSLCNFDYQLTPGGMLIAVMAFLGIYISYLLLKKRYKDTGKRLVILGLGVLLFELFTAPMWNSAHLGYFSYFYNDLSITLTIGWVAMFVFSIYVIENFFGKATEIKKFFLYLIPFTLMTVIMENILVALEIRSYAPEILAISVGKLGLVPIEILYYAPTFGILVLSFYFAWTNTAKNSLISAFKKENLFSTAMILAVGITLYELLIEPLVRTPGYPDWSYFYQDISFLRVGVWVLMIFVGMWMGSQFVKNIKKNSDQFWIYLLSSSIVFYVVEVVLLANRGRIYTESVTTNFTGVTVPILGTPVEVVLAIVMYLVLIISFLKHWRSVLFDK